MCFFVLLNPSMFPPHQWKHLSHIVLYISTCYGILPSTTNFMEIKSQTTSDLTLCEFSAEHRFNLIRMSHLHFIWLEIPSPWQSIALLSSPDAAVYIFNWKGQSMISGKFKYSLGSCEFRCGCVGLGFLIHDCIRFYVW